MTTFNHIEHSGTVTEELSTTTTPIDDGSGGTIFPDIPPDMTDGGDLDDSPIYSFPDRDLTLIGAVEGSEVRMKYAFGGIQEY
jgi:hypothetical protein